MIEKIKIFSKAFFQLSPRLDFEFIFATANHLEHSSDSSECSLKDWPLTFYMKKLKGTSNTILLLRLISRRGFHFPFYFQQRADRRATIITFLGHKQQQQQLEI